MFTLSAPQFRGPKQKGVINDQTDPRIGGNKASSQEFIVKILSGGVTRGQKDRGREELLQRSWGLGA